jgi:hypothetical protein
MPAEQAISTLTLMLNSRRSARIHSPVDHFFLVTFPFASLPWVDPRGQTQIRVVNQATINPLTMTSARLIPSSDRALNMPRFPAELLLHNFSYADRPTIATLSLVDLTFLELVTPLIYGTAHIDDLPLPDTPRTPRLAVLLPSLALSSVRTLHLTLPKQPIQTIAPATDFRLELLPLISLPKLDHLYIHHSQLDFDPNPPWYIFNDLLPPFNPLSITFSLPKASDSRSMNGWKLPRACWAS